MPSWWPAGPGGLMRTTARVLLYRQVPEVLIERLRRVLEQGGDRIADGHV